MGVIQVDGVTGSPEAMAEAAAIFGIDPEKLQDAPVSTVERVRRVASVRSRQKARASEGANAEAERAVSAEDRTVAEFERLCVPCGKFQGKRWSEVPVGFVRWFAGHAWSAASMRQVAMRCREYLAAKYGIAPGELF